MVQDCGSYWMNIVVKVSFYKICFSNFTMISIRKSKNSESMEL